MKTEYKLLIASVVREVGNGNMTSVFALNRIEEIFDHLLEVPPEIQPDEGTLKKVHDALGWQGGTIHQVVAEIKRLKDLESKRVPVARLPKNDQHNELVICDDGSVFALVRADSDDGSAWGECLPIPGTRADK